MQKPSWYLSGNILQLFAGSDETVAGNPGGIQSQSRGAARPVASLPAAGKVPLVVPATGPAAGAIIAAAIIGVAMTSTDLQEVKGLFFMCVFCLVTTRCH